MTHQSDQYCQTFVIKDASGTAITPSDVQSVKVAIGEEVYTTDDQSLKYNATTGKWCAMVRQSQTKSNVVLPIQAEVHFGNHALFSADQIMHTEIERQPLSLSLDWGE